MFDLSWKRELIEGEKEKKRREEMQSGMKLNEFSKRKKERKQTDDVDEEIIRRGERHMKTRCCTGARVGQGLEPGQRGGTGKNWRRGPTIQF